jgi:anti-anti-sigma factor
VATNSSFQCEVEESADRDQFGNHVTTVKCHGRVVSDTSSELRNIVRPLIDSGGRIIIDLGDVSHLDSSGLGTLVGLKVSAMNRGLCILEFRNMTQRVLELLRITKLMQHLSGDEPWPVLYLTSTSRRFFEA